MPSPHDSALPESLYQSTPLDLDDPELDDYRASLAALLDEPSPAAPPAVTAPADTTPAEGYRSPHYRRWSERLVSGLALASRQGPDWLVEHLIPRPSLTFLYGAPKSGKSFAALDLAACVATGRPWGTSQTERGRVLYVLGEGAAGTGKRLDAWSLYHAEVDSLADLVWLPEPVNLTDSDKLDSQVDSLVALCRDLGVSLIVLDTLARCTVGADENSARDMGLVVEALDRLKDSTGAAVLVVHHTGKDKSKGMRGSSALLGAADVVVEVTGSEGRVTLRVDQAKDFPNGREWQFGSEQVGDSLVLVEGATTTAPVSEAQVQHLVEVLRSSATAEGLSNTTWRELAELADSTFYRHKKSAVERGLVRNVGTDRQPRWVTTI